MADHIENEGKKGYFMMWAAIILFLLIGLLIFVYQYNFRFLDFN